MENIMLEGTGVKHTKMNQLNIFDDTSPHKLHRKDGREIVDNNMKELAALVTVYKSIQDAKLPFIDKLGATQTRFGTFFKKEDGYQITKPEGYVAIQYGKYAYKIVDRLTFSAENLNKSPNI